MLTLEPWIQIYQFVDLQITGMHRVEIRSHYLKEINTNLAPFAPADISELLYNPESVAVPKLFSGSLQGFSPPNPTGCGGNRARLARRKARPPCDFRRPRTAPTPLPQSISTTATGSPRQGATKNVSH